MNRSQEREQAFLVLFEKSFNPEASTEELEELAIESGFVSPSDYADRLLDTAEQHLGEIDETIQKYAIGWSLDRLSKVALSIMRLSICEMKYMEDIPEGVSINEAVELAKKYAGKEDSSYINGVLGSVSRADA